MKLVLIYAVIAGVIALATGPIPGTSIVLTGLELVMAYHIARRYKVHLSLDAIGWVAVATYGASEFLKFCVSTLMEFVPIFGWWVAKPLIAVIFVIVLGAIADAYFKDKQRLSQE